MTIPVQTGIHTSPPLDSGLRRNDGCHAHGGKARPRGLGAGGVRGHPAVYKGNGLAYDLNVRRESAEVWMPSLLRHIGEAGG